MPSNCYLRPDGRWHARLRGKHLGYHPDREAAERAVAAARGDVHGILTVGDWAAVWQQYFPGSRNADTARHVDQMCGPFVREHRGDPLASVTRLNAQAWAVRHPSQVKFLRLMFAKAVKAGLLEDNPWAHVEVVAPHRDRIPPTAEQLVLLAAACHARGGWWVRFADMIVFMAYTGLRVSEVADVTAQDVLVSGRVVVRGKRRAGEVEPRTRTVAVFADGADALARSLPDVGLVWKSRQGRPLTRWSAGKAFREVAADAGYDGTIHGLRHHMASWLLDHGATRQDVAVQLGHYDRLGRVDETQVRETYGHVDVESALVRLESAVA